MDNNHYETHLLDKNVEHNREYSKEEEFFEDTN